MSTSSLQVIVVVNGVDQYIGSVVYNEFQKGWRFLPRYQAGPSRKFWATPAEALKGRVKDYRLQTIDGFPVSGF